MTPRKLTDKQESVICAQYAAGAGAFVLAREHGVDKATIYSALKRNGIQPRTLQAAKGGVAACHREEICRRYIAGENTVELSKAFGLTPPTVARYLRKGGVELRDSKAFTSAEELHLCEMYLLGKSTVQLGKEFGVANVTVWKVLRRHGIETRSAVTSCDSVQQALDGDAHFAFSRECSFYVFALARYGDTHCKPGIAFDVDARADEEYGEEALRLVFSTRTEAYFLEQAVLDATRGSKHCPADLVGWDGSSEVRAMAADDMVAVVERLAAEMDDMGVWDFGAAYVPMTAAQRAQCQQRAL